MTVARHKGAKGKADKLFSLLIRSRGACQRCGESNYSKLVTAHIIGRTFSNTRTDELNAWCLCASCHYLVDNFRDVGMALVEQTIGLEQYERLKEKARPASKFDWEAEVVRLKALVDSLERTSV